MNDPPDELEQYVLESELSIPNVLKYVDDYSIYSFYIGAELELRTKYSSPLRLGDNDPSFSLYYSSKKDLGEVIFFKDNSTGKAGDVFMFLRNLMSEDSSIVPIREVLLQINSDFSLGLEGADVGEFKPQLLKKAPVKREPIKIEITIRTNESQEYLEFWKRLDISKKTRDYYYTSEVKVLHYKSSTDHRVLLPKELCISYEIVAHYKIYQPYSDRRDKFRNDYSELFVEGALQLKFEKDFAVITKSMKECLFFYEHYDWETVAGKSENTMINPYFMTEVLLKRYKTVFIWLDPDEAGIRAQQRYLDLYPSLIPIRFDDYIVQKDPTDFYKKAKEHGKQTKALEYLKQLITKLL